MPAYLCTIAIDIEADSPEEAAETLTAWIWGPDPVDQWIVEILAPDGRLSFLEIPSLTVVDRYGNPV